MNRKTCLFSVLALLFPAVVWGDGGAGLPDPQSLADFWAFLKETNYLVLIWDIVKTAALFFVLSIVILVFCFKTRVFKRQNSIWNKLTNLYYLLIPVCMLVISVDVSVPSYLKRTNEELFMQTFVPALDSAIGKAVKNLPTDYQEALESSPEEYFKKAVATALDEEASASAASSSLAQRGFSKAWKTIGSASQTWLAEQAASVLSNKAADFFDADRKTFKASVKALFTKDIQDSSNAIAPFIGSVVVKKINGMISSAQMMILFIPIALMLIPVLDTLIARKLEKRRKDKEAATAA